MPKKPNIRHYAVYQQCVMHVLQQFLPDDISCKIVAILHDAKIAVAKPLHLASVWHIPHFCPPPDVQYKLHSALITINVQHSHKLENAHKWTPVIRSVVMTQPVTLITDANVSKAINRYVHYTLTYANNVRMHMNA